MAYNVQRKGKVAKACILHCPGGDIAQLATESATLQLPNKLLRLTALLHEYGREHLVRQSLLPLDQTMVQQQRATAHY